MPVALRIVRRPPSQVIAVFIYLVLVLAAGFAAAEINYQLGLRVGPGEYNLPAWELRAFPNKWLYKFHELLHGKPSGAEQDLALVRFFGLTREARDLEQRVSDATRRGAADPDLAAALRSKQDERASLQSEVEATIEGRITAVAEDQDLTRSLLFLPAFVWPPVDFQFTTAPRTLAVSPRDRIELKSTSLLREGLSIDQVEKIETDRELKGDVSALAFPTSGVGAYPTIVGYTADYASALEIIAHEWTHNYLAFRPLGFHYYKDNDLRTMNETIADLVGHELAGLVLGRWPLAEPAAGAQTPPKPDPAIDLGAELRKLRGEVDALLAQGKVEDAETLMEERREFLADHGYTIRKLNQAYFAFTNLYAGELGSPGAVNPIGPKIDELRRRAGSLREFLSIAGEFTSVADLDRALEKLR